MGRYVHTSNKQIHTYLGHRQVSCNGCVEWQEDKGQSLPCNLMRKGIDKPDTNSTKCALILQDLF